MILLKNLLKEAYYKVGIKEVSGSFLLDPWGQLINIGHDNDELYHFKVFKLAYEDIYDELHLKYKNVNKRKKEEYIFNSIFLYGFVRGTCLQNTLFLGFCKQSLNEITKKVLTNIIAQKNIQEIIVDEVINEQTIHKNQELSTKEFIDKYL